MRKALAVVAMATVLFTSGCATRTIDPDTSGSVPVEGTSWMMFCRGTTAVIWVPGHAGENDELEALHYEDPECMDGVAPQVEPTGPRDEGDGILEEDEE